MSGGIKKWLMLQMWRLQQVAQILTIAMLAVTLTLTIYDKMSWREGSLFSTPYVGGSIILLTLAAAIWIFAFIWDMRLRMWREQMMVVAERNPYMREKMNTKELVLYQLSWLPILEGLGKTDPQVRESAESLKLWMKKVLREDPSLSSDVKEVFEYIGKPLPDYMMTDREES